MIEPPDQQVRLRALDPRESFIVQAPAGSGKTGLLTQRYLKLLSGVDAPEAIVALTFTKKAAGEMRERILAALRGARLQRRPEDTHEQRLWDLGKTVLERDLDRNWNLEANPARLQIMTIDSLCSRLSRALPILSQFGASPSIVDDAERYYLEAAEKTLAHVREPDSPHREALGHLLLHLDNDLRRVRDQIAGMLARRDKWLRPLGELLVEGKVELGPQSRRRLEGALEQVVREELEALKEAFPREQLSEAVELARFAAGRLDPDSPLAGWLAFQGNLPSASPEEVPLWLGLRSMLLTGKGEWRKSVNKRDGFPADKDTQDPTEKVQRKQAKARAKELLGQLSDQEGLAARLHDVGILPPLVYSDAQWETLLALLNLCLLAAAQLIVVFRSAGRADFVEVARSAERALGTEEEPTEMAMALDASLQHLLVDEFQDTSLSQLRLLESLTREWVEKEGRTLFLVGDPMQSIYRFRDAEVGNFLQIRRQGLPHLSLEPLELTANFRSRPCLVEWFNQTFSSVFPGYEDPAVGAVAYSAATPGLTGEGTDPVEFHPLLTDPYDSQTGREQEASAVIEVIRRTWEEDSSRTIAILVRSRSHLRAILPALRQAGYRYQGLDLESLTEQPVVQDLISLTRAMLCEGDRTAWLALLRAPWCGLMTDDLLVLARDQGKSTIPARLSDDEVLAGLSHDGAERVERFWKRMSPFLQNRNRRRLSQSVEAAWLSLGGPSCVRKPTDLEDARAYLDLLVELEREYESIELPVLERKVQRLYARPDIEADGRLQIMTIHKSKGLQFDTVILPGLSERGRPDEEPLLSWLERRNEQGGSDLLLAPITGRGESDKDPCYQFVNGLEKKKSDNESTRLLYVAATRAERKLHLFSLVHAKDLEQRDLRKPTRGSFLSYLWPALGEGFSARVQWDHAPASLTLSEEPATPEPPELRLRRLPVDWQPPELAEDVEVENYPDTVAEAVEERPTFEWAGETVRHVGSVVHRVLQQVGRQGLDQWPLDRVEELGDYLEARLSERGVPPAEIPGAVKRAQMALRETLSSARGRWMLQGGAKARSEYALSAKRGSRISRHIVDRTFVDDEGVLWVVDYKTGSHEGGDRDAFLDAEQERYRGQLERYASLLRQMEYRPVKMGLYFPLVQGWREWG